MIRKFLFIFSIAIINIYAYEDLGTYGELLEIKEKDFMETLNQRFEALDKKKLENEVQISAKNSFIIKSNLKTCIDTKTRVFEPTIELNNDINIPYTGETLAKKGKHNILEENKLFMPYNIIFIDADDKIQVELAELYKKVLKDKIRVFVAKGDYLELNKNSLFSNSKVVRDNFEIKAFNVQCLPSIYTQQNYQFIINEYNPEKLVKNENK